MNIDEAWIEIAEDFAKRITVLEDDNEQVCSQLIDLNHRIAALEAWRRDLNILKKRIADLEHTWNPAWDKRIEQRIDALEVELREFNNWVLKRIDELLS